MIFGYIILFVLLSGVLSLAGGILLLGRPEWVRRFAGSFVSFAAGALLAIAFLDLLPEALQMSVNHRAVFAAALVGILSFFIIERLILQFHSHHHIDEDEHHHAAPILLSIGDALHNFVDGVVIAGAFLVNMPLGILTAVAVAAHEIPQEIGDFSIMLHHGWSRRKVIWTNIWLSLTSVLGAILAFVFRGIIEPILPEILAFTAGIFIYIAGTDLIPEITAKGSRDKTGRVVTMLLLGVLAVWLLSVFLE